ncbi:MAG: hypothetical protein LBS70_08010, partial [Candidatus Accumulibacter sp.]|nr:hypothetical protein [Accumulibacter sp.]
MDPNIIYVKTAAGENAIMQRSQILQRNVRMVLILVDGHSSVSDLTRKVGNLQLTESALVELEMSGLIEPKPEAPDPLEEETRRVAEEIRTAASGKKKKGARAAKMAQEAPPEPPAESSPEEIVETPSDSDIGAGASEPRAPEEPEPAVPG